MPPTDPTALEAHQTADCQALSLIHSTIDDENFQVFLSCMMAYEAFQALCQHHSDTGGISTATLFFELVNLQVTADVPIKEHVHHFCTLHNKLKSNIKISNHFIAIILLFSLPSEFTPLVQTTLTTTVFDKIDINHLYMLILVSTKVESSEASSSHTAMVASQKHHRGSYRTDRTRSEKHKAPTSSTYPLKCSRGHIGHTDDQCRVHINEAKYKQIAELASRLDKMERSASDSAKIAITSPLDYDEAFITANTPSMILTLDAGATSHMFSNQDLLSTYDEIEPSKIEVAAKGRPIFATGRGTARIQGLHLKNILISSALGVNLVLAGQLYDQGYGIVWGRTYAHVKNDQGVTVITFH